ncbi:recombinase family protein [Psychrobacter cryohalolentis]|uniref:recombinase family protein n=1 Tax=Psychrobacter cryohalolentis TaxID=330922 RepID=UPI0000570F1F|nr:recombinase family protein [Psychrobacter cryohalolentis]ASE25337.1 resolvase [Psychrobacter cryohalolentis]|tara:strand:- start:1582 stop:2172 length:591 start_codon:yes stop_codon:yes gene_type:complete
MTVRIYVRASTKDQDATRALAELVAFSTSYDDNYIEYVEHFSGTKLDRPALAKLLKDAEKDDILLVESVDRLSRLSQDDFAILKQRIKDKGLRLVVADLPTTYTVSGGMTGDILTVINHMLIDLLATMAKLDNDKRRERIKQGLANSGYKPTGKKPNTTKHNRIRELDSQANMTKEEIAKAVGVGVATVYRVLKQD